MARYRQGSGPTLTWNAPGRPGSVHTGTNTHNSCWEWYAGERDSLGVEMLLTASRVRTPTTSTVQPVNCAAG